MAHKKQGERKEKLKQMREKCLLTICLVILQKRGITSQSIGRVRTQKKNPSTEARKKAKGK